MRYWGLVMEVDEEDEVVVVVEVRQGEMWKWALSSRKRVHAATVTQTPVGSQVQGSQVGSGNVGSTERLCKRCVKHQIQCMVVGGGAQCKNC